MKGPEPKLYKWDGKELTIKQLCMIKGAAYSQISSRLNYNGGIVTEELLSPDRPKPKKKRKAKDLMKEAMNALPAKRLACNEKIM